MPSIKLEHQLSDLFEQWAGTAPDLILPLAPSGSDRVYYRLQKDKKSAIGAYSPDPKETTAFLSFSKHFHAKGLPVPEIYAEHLEQKIYLQEDLGFTTLYSYLLTKGEYFPDYLIQIYKKVALPIALSPPIQLNVILPPKVDIYAAGSLPFLIFRCLQT